MESQYLEAIVKPLVSFPDDVRVEKTQDDLGTLLMLHLNQQDMGKIIGRNGETAKAIRCLIRCFGAMNKAHISMKIYEPERPERENESYGERRPYPTHRQDDEFSL